MSSTFLIDEGVRSTVMNLALISLNGGSLKIALTEAEFKEFEPAQIWLVPLKIVFNFSRFY